MDILSLGILVADVMTRRVKRLPEKGKLELIDEIQIHSGGCAANTAIALSKLGIRTGLAGRVGQDAFGKVLLEIYKSYDLDISGVKQSQSTQTSATIVMVDESGERSFLHTIGANAEFGLIDISPSDLRRYKILHIGGALLLPNLDGEPMAQLLVEAKRVGLVTSIDTAWDAKNRWLEILKPTLPFIDIFLPSIEEAKMISGFSRPEEIANFFLDYGVKIVGLKMGDKGCCIRTNCFELTLPAYDIKPIDTTGAGDAFVAGFLTGLINDWPLSKIAEFANAVGAMATLALGAADGVKSIEETLEFMHRTSLKS